MTTGRIWAVGYMVFMALLAIGLMLKEDKEAARIQSCEARGHEWRVIKEQGWASPIMGCVVIPPQSPRTPAKQ